MAKRLLIVDDEPDLIQMATLFFVKEGFEVEGVRNGQEALDKVAEGPFDLIILDVMMPGMDGYEVCHRLKMQRETNVIPILMLSAKDTEKDRIVGLQTGADGYVFKPFEAPELLAKVKELLERSERHKEAAEVRQKISFSFISHFRYLEEVNTFIGDLFRHTSLNPDEIWELKLALHELGANAIEHGNKMDPNKKVGVTFTLFQDRLEFEITDEGQGFSPSKVPDPTMGDAVVRERGRGIYLVSQVVDKIEYSDGGKKALLIKHFKS